MKIVKTLIFILLKIFSTNIVLILFSPNDFCMKGVEKVPYLIDKNRRKRYV